MPAVRRWLSYGKRSRQMLMRRARELPEEQQLELLTQMNVIVQMEHLKTHPAVKRRLKQRNLTLRGWVYRIHDGEILQLHHRTGEFLPWP